MSSDLHQPASHLIQNRKPFNCKGPAPGGQQRLWPPLHVGCSSATWSLRRPPKLDGGDQKTPSRPPLTATSVIGNSGAPLEHLASVTACNTVSLGAERVGFTPWNQLGTYFFFANGAEGGGVRERALGPPTHPLAHRGPRCLAAQGGKGEL
jgi:hypothetical protein